MPDADESGTICALNYYPIKGLSPVPVDSVVLEVDGGFPGDRLFGFAKANSGFDVANPKPLPKDRFLVLAQQEKLAELHTFLDENTRDFLVTKAGREILRVDLKTKEGKAEASRYFFDFLGLSEEERPHFVEAQPHRFTDVSVVSETLMNAVSLINLASVRDFENQIGQPVDPARFRANIIFDNWPAFHEFDLVGEMIRAGEVSLKILARTKRCAATQVNPETAKRDLQLPALLRKTYGHFDMGIYAQIVSDGMIGVNDQIHPT